MRPRSFTTIAIAALVLLACGDETPTSPDDAALKKAGVASAKTDSAVVDSLHLKRGALMSAGRSGATKESTVCSSRKRELAAVRNQLSKESTAKLRSSEVSLFAIVADVCN